MSYPQHGRRGSTLAATLALSLGAALGAASPAVAGLAVVGEDSNTVNYPLYVEDANGLRLALCDAGPAGGCPLSELPEGDAPVSFPDNYAVENFFFAADSELSSGGVNALIGIALETTYVNDAVVAGEEAMFTRIRLEEITGLDPNTTYRVMHPYGEFDVTSDGGGTVDRTFHTDDVGCFAPTDEEPGTVACANGGWKRATDAWAGDFGGADKVAPFLTWDPAQAPAAPAGFIGDFNTPHRVVGSPALDETGAPQNYFRIVEKSATPRKDVRTTSFNLQGKIAAVSPTNAPTTPNLADASDTGWSHLDNLTKDTTPTFTGRASAGTVDLRVGGQVVAAGVPVTGGTYSATVPADKALGQGAHKVSVAQGALTSGEATITVDTAAPPVPAAPGVTPRTAATAWLAWAGVAGAERYQLFRDGVAGATMMAEDIGVGASAYVGGLSGRISQFAVTATDEAGNTSARSANRAVGVPGKVAAYAASGSATDRYVNARASWTAAAANGSAVTSYRVTAIRSRTYTKSTSVFGPAYRAAYIPRLSRGVYYRFQVTATNRFGAAVASTMTPWVLAR